jgi:hypothetical protein
MWNTFLFSKLWDGQVIITLSKIRPSHHRDHSIVVLRTIKIFSRFLAFLLLDLLLFL